MKKEQIFIVVVTIFHVASENVHLEMVAFSIEKGANCHFGNTSRGFRKWPFRNGNSYHKIKVEKPIRLYCKLQCAV